MFTVEWNSHSEQVESATDVDRLLDRLHVLFVSDPRMVIVSFETGESLSIGLGREITVLCSTGPDKNPPYYVSRGAVVDGTIEFLFGGEWTEYLLKNAVPISVAREAIRRFCE